MLYNWRKTTYHLKEQMTTKNKAIEFSAVKPGDVIRTTTTYPRGTTTVSEGTVGSVHANRIYSDDGADLAYLDRNIVRNDISIELLSRPTVPYESGSFIRAVLTDGDAVNLLRVEKTSMNDEMVWLELGGDGQRFVTEGEINSWYALELVNKP